MILKGREGVLRILDSADVLHGVAPRDDATVDMVHFDGASTYTNLTANLDTDDTTYANNMLADNDDRIYIGSDIPFARISFLKGGGAEYAAGSGALKLYYFNGTDFNSTLAGSSDGTFISPDCFAKDGIISFKAPADWGIGANAFNANLDSDKYYIYLQTTTSSTTDVDVDLLCPVDGQYFEVAFSKMDFNGPIGRARPDEILVMERGLVNSKMHYVNTSVMKLYEPIPISFSCLIDDTYNKNDIELALACGNPGSTRWTSTGTTSKATTMNDGSVANPAFADPTNKKAVNVQILFTSTASGGLDFGWAYYETYFPGNEITVSEGEDGNILTAAGGVYGVIEMTRILANRY